MAAHGIRRAARALDRLEEIIIATLLAAATLLIFVAVVQRYGLSGVASLYRWSRAEGLEGLSAASKSAFFFAHRLRSPDLGAGTLHLHDRLDGQVRRRA